MARIIRMMVFVALFLAGMTAVASAEEVGLSAELSGANEVGDPGDLGGSGSAVVTIDSETAEVCFTITTTGTTEDPVAGHIHEGADGANGGVVVDSAWETNAGTGCVAGDADVVAAILANPAGYYVNVHTPEFPAGAIRGQLVGAEAQLAVTGPNSVLLLVVAGAVFMIGGVMLAGVSRRRAA